MFGKDQRKHARIESHYLVKYTLPDGTGGVSFARDLSAEGMLMHSFTEMDTGTTLALRINFPGIAGALSVKGEVLRIQKLKRLPGCEVGVKFVDIDERSKEFLDAAIRKALRR